MNCTRVSSVLHLMPAQAHFGIVGYTTKLHGSHSKTSMPLWELAGRNLQAASPSSELFALKEHVQEFRGDGWSLSQIRPCTPSLQLLLAGVPGWTLDLLHALAMFAAAVLVYCLHGGPFSLASSGDGPAPAAPWQQGSGISLRKAVSGSGRKNNPLAFSPGSGAAPHRSMCMSCRDDSSVIFL